MRSERTVRRRSGRRDLRRVAATCLVLVSIAPACGGGDDDDARPTARAESAEDAAREAAGPICAETNEKLQALEWPASPRNQAVYLTQWRKIMSAAVERIGKLEGPEDDPSLFRRYAARFAEPLRVAERARKYARAGDRASVEMIIWRFGPQLEEAQIIASSEGVAGCESFPYHEWN
ncbi:MAG: hypothetical protein M3310_02995 [Actinomycetota bacterium]|nr:hypothetical protein [Actinomycetota bacterium]